MYYIFGNPKSINDLHGHFNFNVGKLRTETKICIIDDEVFKKKNMLEQHSYTVKEIGDPTDINAVAAYHIILCDIKGVGKAFESEFEGGHLIEEIHNFYPNKVIVAYSGEGLDTRFNKYFQIADQALQKDATDELWRTTLDNMIELVHSPIEQWKKTRKRLLELDISSKDLIAVEDLFVKSYLEKRNLFINNKIINILHPDVKSILLNIASSIIYSKVLGGV